MQCVLSNSFNRFCSSTGLRLIFALALIGLGACGGSNDDNNGDGGGSGDSTCGTDGCKITASDGAQGDFFGASVAIDPDVVVVGAEGDDGSGSDSGSAYVYRLDGADLVQEQKLTASDAAEDDAFGGSVALDGNVIVVGARGDDDDGPSSGSAYVYRYDGADWAEEDKLTASDGAADDSFGVSVALDADAIVVGADEDDDKGENSGAAYVYRFNGATWAEEQKLTASDGAEGDFFGGSVALEGDVVVVGVANSNAAYVYRFDAGDWAEEQKLTASDAAAGDLFGMSVAVDGDVIVVGALFDADNGFESGSAYVYRFNGATWVEEQKLTASDGAAGDEFGIVAVSADVIVVGAVGHDDNAPGSGSAYVYRFNGATWDEEEELTASDAFVNDKFGGALDVDGDVIVVGADRNDDDGSNSGSAYVFEL